MNSLHSKNIIRFALVLVVGALCASIGPDASARQTRIPFDLEYGLIIVKASIEDRDPADFILDTGCGPEVMLSLATAREIGILTGDEPNLAGDIGSAQFITRSRKTISRFSFAGDVRKIREPAVIDLGFVERQTGLRVAGLIGQTLLDDYLVTIDYPKRQIILRSDEEASEFRRRLESEGPTGVNLVRKGTARILVEAKLGDMPGHYLLDTGSARGILYEPAVTALKKESPAARPAPARSVQTAFEKVEVQHASVPRFAIGDVEFVDQVFALHNAPVLVSQLRKETGLALWGTIGCQLLREFAVTIDCERDRLYLVAPGSF